MRRLEGRTVVITGATNGIGLALSRRLGTDGMRVMMADVEEPALAAAAGSLAAVSVEVATMVTDVSDAVAISESLYHELAAIGSPVRVSVLCPGMVRTRIYEANRNWPAKYGSWPVVRDPPDIAIWRQAASARVEAGTDPASIATAVRDAIVSERFWILTHPEFGDLLRDKYDGAVAGCNPWPLAGG